MKLMRGKINRYIQKSNSVPEALKREVTPYRGAGVVTGRSLYLRYWAIPLVALVMAVIFAAPALAGTVYVKADASGTNNGSSWANAYTKMQSALAAAVSGDQIWVAEGAYYPDEGTGQTDNNRSATFNLKNGVALYGGFAGTEANLGDRNWETHVTVLSGDIDQNDTGSIVGSNSYNVVTAHGVDATAVLDGFTVSGGNADGGSYPGPATGGGMLIYGQFLPAPTPTITHVVFSGNRTAYHGGGVFIWDGAPILTDVKFVGNSAGNYGGGIASFYSSGITLTNVVFDQNSATYLGGGLYSQNNVTILGGSFTDNTAGRGGGFYSGPTSAKTGRDSVLTDVSFNSNHATDTTGYGGADSYCNGGGGMGHISGGNVTLTRVDFQNNTSNIRGGGLYFDNKGGTAGLSSVSFSGNQSLQGGAGLYNNNNNLTIAGGSFTGNLANTGNGDGGGLFQESGSLMLTDAVFSGNSARHGGGLEIDNGTVNISRITFEGNSAAYSGGGLYIWGATVVMSDIIFTGNSAPYGGGATNTATSVPVQMNRLTFILNKATAGDGGGLQNYGKAVMRNMIFYGNSAYNGGGLQNYFTHSGASISNALFVGNSASNYGGGVYNEDDAGLTVTNSTFTGNSATSFGGGLFNTYNSTLTLHNCIMSGDTATEHYYNEIYPDSLTVTYSLVQGGYGGTGNINQAPMFMRSPSPGTDGVWGTTDDDYGDLRLLGASPAIDAGDNSSVPVDVTTDMSGNQRFVDIASVVDTGSGTAPIVDMGSYEADGVALSYTLIYMAAGHGSISGDSPQTVAYGGSGTEVTAVADAGYSFVRWSDGSTVNPRTDNNVTGNITVSATFKAATTTSITSDTPDPSEVGQTVTVNYSVSVTPPASGTPTGNVTVSDGVNSCTGTVAAGTCNITLTTSGSRSLTASYAGDSNFSGSTSSSVPHFVKAATTTSITSDTPDPSVINQTVMVSYSVSVTASGSSSPASTGTVKSASLILPPGGTPTGNVTVSDGVDSCTGTVAAGQCNINLTTVGERQLTATYGGDADFSTSSSSPVTHNVCGNSITVTNNADGGPGSLRQAIVDVCPDGTIGFGDDFTIVLTGTLGLGRNMTIDGAGHIVTVSGDNALRVFEVGSGISFSLNSLTVANGKSPDGFGGGIQNLQGTLTVTNSTFSGNVSTYRGGGIYSEFGTLNVTNCTFTGNSATTIGGGFSSHGGPTTVTNSTFSGNLAQSGGGIHDAFGNVNVTNSVLVNSGGGNCSNISSSGSNNLADDSSCGPGFTTSSSVLLGALDNYGGSTETFPLLPGSSAIDAGKSSGCPLFDQRGITRDSLCDVGAFESRGFTFGTPTGTPQSTPINMAFATDLGVDVNSSFSEPVDGGVITFTAPSSGASTTFAPTTTAVISGGAATLTVTANGTTGGPYTVTASGSGVSGSVSFELTNLKTGQTITVTQPAPGSAVFGESFTVAATGGDSGNPVVIAVSGGCSGSGNGSAIITMSSSTTDCTVTYDQAGNDNYSDAPTVTETVTAQKAPTTTTLGSAVVFSVPLPTVTLTATAGSLYGTPSGAVTFQNGGVDISGCVGVALVSGSATCITNSLSPGVYDITAAYSGSAEYLTSVSDILSVSTFLGKMSRNSHYLSPEGWLVRAYTKADAPNEVYLEVIDTDNRLVTQGIVGMTGNPLLVASDAATPEVSLGFDRGTKTAQVIYTSAGGRQVVQVPGIRKEQLGVTPEPLVFGTVRSGSSLKRTVTISNTGSTPLHITAIGTPGAPFSLAPTGTTCAAGSTLAAGGSCSIAVRFTPTAVAVYNGSFVVSSDSGSVTVHLSGTGGL